MRARINKELHGAIKNKDKRRVSTLRLINAAIKDRDIAVRTEGNIDGVSDKDILSILSKMIKQRQESIKLYEEAGRMELVQQESEESEIIKSFLPQQMSEDEIETACKQAVEEIDAAGLKDMGKVMGLLKEKYQGLMDFGKAGAFVKKSLT